MTTIKNFVIGIRDGFMVPGQFIVSLIIQYAPSTARKFGLTGGDDSFVAIMLLSLLFWGVVVLVAWRFYRYGHRIFNIAVALFWTLLHRANRAFGSLKTMVVCRYRELVARGPSRSRGQTGIEASSGIDFDDVDLVVLRSAAVTGPGLSLSAPDIAEKFTLRPSQVQKSVDKLLNSKLLALAMGSTDGYDNFTLTPSGASFFDAWQKQNSAA